MDEQRRKARENWKGSGEEAVAAIYHQLGEEGIRSDFTGYDAVEGSGEIQALLVDGQRVESADVGSEVEIITSATPFYGESGGQVGDRGEIVTSEARAAISDTKRPLPDVIVHRGTVKAGTLRLGAAATLRVDALARQVV